MSKLESAGERLATLKAQKDALVEQAYTQAAELIAEFEDSVQEEWEEQITILQDFQRSTEPTVKDEARALLKLYKRDKRNEHNTLKGINIGVARAFEHRKLAQDPPLVAKLQVIDSMVRIAKEKGVHSRYCSCNGTTDGCKSVDNYVTDESNLPLSVINKIETWAQRYADSYKPQEIAIGAGN